MLKDAKNAVMQSGLLLSLPTDLYSIPNPEPLMQSLKPLLDLKYLCAAERIWRHHIGTEPWSDGDATVAWINPMTHRLQSLAPRNRPKDVVALPTEPVEMLCEVARLATSHYTYAIRALPDTRPAPITRQSERLTQILAKPCELWSNVPLLRLWGMAILTLATLPEGVTPWLCAEIRREAEAMNIYDSSRLMYVLGRVAWEKEFSRKVLDTVWEVPRQVVEIDQGESTYIW